MSPRLRRKCQKRFHELAVKEALGTATPAEMEKLERYQRLLREPEDPKVRQKNERVWYSVRQLIRGICTLKANSILSLQK